MFAGLISCQYFYDKSKSKSPLLSPYVPKADVVKAADLGLDSAASSLYWLAAIQYFGYPQPDQYQKMDDYINLATNLDPKFSHPYAFATLIMPSIGLTDEAIEIGKGGVEKAEPNWEIPYNLALVYHMEKADQANASKYFDIAGRTLGAPSNAQWLAANYGSKPDFREQSKLIWKGVAEDTKDEVIRERAIAHLYQYELMDFLEEQGQIYKAKFGSYPDPIDKLVEVGILKEMPKDPFGYNFKFDDEGKVRLYFSK